MPHREVRLDIDPDVCPDIVANIKDMTREVEDDFADIVYSSHNLEHLHEHEVEMALREFLRVLKPRGRALIAVPDLEEVARVMVTEGIDAELYESPSGPIYPRDVIYGFRQAIERGNYHYCHRTGFSADILRYWLSASGFVDIEVKRIPEEFALCAIAWKDGKSEDL
jgi:SAM-dependent methyltransferase